MLHAVLIPLSCAKCTTQLLDLITVTILDNGAKCEVSYVIFIIYLHLFVALQYFNNQEGISYDGITLRDLAASGDSTMDSVAVQVHRAT